LEYANSVWNPHTMRLINDLENVQIRATKLVITLKHLRYKDSRDWDYQHYDSDACGYYWHVL